LTEKRQILKSAWVIGLATVASRICGFFRDQRITLLLGTSGVADSFILAFRIPNLLRRLVAEGSLTAAFIPVFSRYLAHRPKEEVWRFAHRLFWALALLLGAISIAGMIFAPQLVHLFTLFGKSSAQWQTAVVLTRIIFPYIFFIGLAALAMAILNSFHVFGLPATTSILFNLSLIVFSIGAVYRPIMHWAPAAYRSPAVAISIGVLVGGALQFLVQVPELIRRGMHFHFDLSLRDPGVRQVGKLMLPGLVGIGVFQMNFFADTVFATSAKMPGGSITSLYVADRVMELVLGSYAIAVSTAILPHMSEQAAKGNWDALKQTLSFSLRMVSFITVPAAVGLMILRVPLITVLFQHGLFTHDSTTLTARALLYYALGLPGFAAVRLVVPAFYSQQDTQTPVKVAAGAVALNIVLNVLFIAFLFSVFQNGSPALATSLAAYFNFLLLFLILRRRLGKLGAKAVAVSLSKVAICSALMGAVCYLLLLRSGFGGYQHFLQRAGALGVMIAAAAGVYFAAAKILGCEELGELVSMLRRPAPEIESSAAMLE
jgi:putative peptidoglycan lipid II flippase